MAEILKKLTPKQERFVAEYLIDLNATAAYKRAGYKAKGNSAEVNAARMLRNAQVAAAVREGMVKRAERVELKSDDVLREIMCIAFSNLADTYDSNGKRLPIQEMPEHVQRSVRRLVQSRSSKVADVELWDKVKALDLLGRHLKLWRGSDTVNVNFNFLYAERLERARARINERRRADIGKL